MKLKSSFLALGLHSLSSNALRNSTAARFALVTSGLLCGVVSLQAADQTWTGSSSGAWRTTGNWSGGAFPGSSTTTTNTDLVTIAVAAQPTMGINFNNATSGVFSFGGINFGSTTNRVLGSSSGTVGGVLTLNGATINSVSNVIIRNSSSGSFTFQAAQTSTMGIALGNATNNVVSVDGTGNVVIESNITGSNRKLTVNAASSGDLRLSGTNTFTGGIDITGGTAGGRLRVDTVASLPTSGTIALSTGGRLTLNIAGTFGGASQALTFSPNQTTNAALDILSGAAVIWQGTVGINGDTRIEANGATGSLTFSGNASGSGQLLKQAAGTLTLSGTGNTLTGSTQIGNGTLSISNGSMMGTGALTLSQTSTNATTLTLNNTTQSVGTLSSSWTATTGTIDQRINLNGTALTINQDADGTFGTGAVSTLTSTISGTGSLIKAGNSKLTLSSANNYTGTTSINAGILAVNGSLASGSAVTVNSGGTLGGSGTVNGTVSVKSGGIVGPGNSPGVLTTGATSFENGSIFSWDLAADVDHDGTTDGTRGTDYDGLSASSLSVASGAVFRVVLSGTASADLTSTFWDQNQVWDNIFSVSGATTNAATGALFNAFQVFNGTTNVTLATASQGSFSFNGSTLTWTAVPEPTSALVGLLITAGLLRRRRGA